MYYCQWKQKELKSTITGEDFPTIKEKPVKSLGGWYNNDITDRHQGVDIYHQVQGGLKSKDKARIKRKFKVWCLQCNLYP